MPNGIVKSESDPIDIQKDRTWQETFQELMDKAITERKEPAAIIYYQQAMKEELPGPSFDQFQNSLAYKYWLMENEAAIEELRGEWVMAIMTE